MRVLMLAQSPVAGDARILREAMCLRDEGDDVTVVGRGVPAGADLPGGVRVLDAGRSGGLGSVDASRTTRAAVVSGARQAARWVLLPEHRGRVEAAWRASAARLVADLGSDVEADVVHAHDRNTLALAARLAAQWSVPLVYDAHELWSHRDLPGRPTPFGTRRATVAETARARSAALVITVSEGIADVLRGRGLGPVVVVRNTFPAHAPAEVQAPSGVQAPARPGLVYAGRIGEGRDLQTLVAAASPDLPVLLVGPADPTYAARLRLRSDVQLEPALPVDDLDAVYREHGIAAVTLTDGCLNHRLALPNKLFHAVRAGVPVVAADLPEIRQLVQIHDLGELYRPGDAASLVAAARRVAARYEALLRSVAAAAEALSWEHDARVLLAGYAVLRR